MAKLLSICGQVLIYGLIALVLGYFSTRPAYDRFPEDKAQLIISLSHVGQRKEPCRKLTQEEIQAIAANMRRSEVCGRERLPLFVEVLIGEEVIYSAVLPPSGLSRDGVSRAYERLIVPVGYHKLTARLNDSARVDGFDYEQHAKIELAQGENYVIDFRSEMGGFLFGGR